MEPPSSSSCTKADDPAELRRRPLHVNVAREKLELEDLSLTCRRDRYCVMCVRAFCSHCCAPHHVLPLGYHIVVPIDAATGKPVVPDHYPGRWRQEPITDFAVGLISSAGDYAEALPRDGYCIYCLRAFSTASCPHHQHCCPPGCFVRIVERDGRRCG
uniref:Uncharacterized protein n=1 Tax=Oryza brachyantha TaxID=4533 RepID=J3KYE3_ORYBR